MATVTKKRDPLPPPPLTFTIELNVEEARALRTLVGWISQPSLEKMGLNHILGYCRDRTPHGTNVYDIAGLMNELYRGLEN